MNGLVGQRIVRKICNNCKQSYKPPAPLIEEMRNILGTLFPTQKEILFYKGKGCQECGDAGYIGRIGIFEVVSVSEKIIPLILQNADSEQIEKQARLEGMITMKQDGYLKVLQGITTIEEVLRVAQE
jgi:type II secretory ATPase GspE/PulE/Tfp pilus assembly ATPase PilB-like protein